MMKTNLSQFSSNFCLFFSMITCSFLLNLGCGRSSSQLKHDLNEPIRPDAAAHSWVDVADRGEKETFYWRFYAQVFDASDGVPVLPQGNALEQRLAYWVQKIDTHLRRQYPDKLKNIPKPQVRVVWNGVPNAMVMAVPVCLNVGLRWGASQANGGNHHQGSALFSSVLLDSSGAISLWDDSICIKESIDSLEQAQHLAQTLNATMKSCHLTVMQEAGSSFYFQADDGCQKDIPSGIFSMITGASQLAILKSSNIVVVHMGTVSLLNEEHVVPVLAHELGHYYRSHPTVSLEDPRYNYFYQIPESGKNDDHKPVPTTDPELIQLGKTLLKKRTIGLKYRKVAGQQWLSEFFIPMINLAQWGMKHELEQKACSKNEDRCSCSQYIAWLNQPEVKKELKGFPFRPLSSSGQSLYFEHEKKVALCLSKFNAKEALSMIEQKESSEGFEGLFAFDQDLFETFFKGHVDALLAAIIDAHPDTTVLNFLAQAQQRFEINWKKYQEPFENAAKLRLGYYTHEQEADELALEWLSSLNWLQQAIIEQNFLLGIFKSALYEAFGQSLPLAPGEVPISLCQEYYQNDWKDAQGNPIFIPIGDYRDSHHSECFRAYNLSAEIKAHNYALQSDPVVFRHEQLTNDWQTITNQAMSLKDQLVIYKPHQTQKATIKIVAENFINKNCPLTAHDQHWMDHLSDQKRAALVSLKDKMMR